MKDKTFSPISPKHEPNHLDGKAIELPALPPLNLHELPKGCSALLVEISGGLVQDVSLLNRASNPILVTVRDHDNYKDDPWAYQDADWFLKGKECSMANTPTCLIPDLDDQTLEAMAKKVQEEIEKRGLPDVSFKAGYKAGFLAALQDENVGPGQVWTDREAIDLFQELDRRFAI